MIETHSFAAANLEFTLKHRELQLIHPTHFSSFKILGSIFKGNSGIFYMVDAQLTKQPPFLIYNLMEGPSWDPIADHRKAAARVRKAIEKPQGQLLLTKRIAHALKELS